MAVERAIPVDAAERRAWRSEVLGLFEIACAMALAGSTVVVGKVLSVRIPVFLSAELSLCAALLAILPAQLVKRRELGLLSKRELGYMFLQALFGIVLFRALTLYGLRFTTAMHAGLITSVVPAVMAVLAAIFLKERIRVRGLIGAGLAMSGLLLITIGGLAFPIDPGFLRGDLLVFGATVCEALLTLFRKSSGGRIGSVTNTTVLVFMSAVMLLPSALLELRDFDLRSIETTGWLAVVYYGAVATVIAYILWGDGALRIPANRTGMATAVMPLSAVILSALVLGEELAAAQAAGCAVVVAAILVGRK